MSKDHRESLVLCLFLSGCSSMGSALNLAQPNVFSFHTISYVYFLITLYSWLTVGQACGPRAERDVSTDLLVLCRACGHEVANGSDIHYVPSRFALSSHNNTLLGGRRVTMQLFENPLKRRFEVVTFRRAAVALHWPADTRYSWFPGFAWMKATCPRCKAHLGWGFQPDSWLDTVPVPWFEESESTFLGLITHGLLTEDFASRLLMTPKSFVS